MTQESTGSPANSRQGHSNRKPLWIGLGLVALVGSFLAGGAFGQVVRAGGGCLFGGGHPAHFGKHGSGFLADPDAAREHVQAGAAWLLRAVDATDEQRARVNAILDPITEDLLVAAEAHHKGHASFVEALAAPTVDRTRLEEIRAGQVALVDQASQRIVTGIADLAEVLTPEQREKLIDMARAAHR